MYSWNVEWNASKIEGRMVWYFHNDIYNCTGNKTVVIPIEINPQDDEQPRPPNYSIWK